MKNWGAIFSEIEQNNEISYRILDYSAETGVNIIHAKLAKLWRKKECENYETFCTRLSHSHSIGDYDFIYEAT